MRSKWKGPNSINPSKIKTLKDLIYSRSQEVTPKMIGQTLHISSGNKIFTIQILEEMLGHKLGEFVRTRAEFEFKKKKK